MFLANHYGIEGWGGDPEMNFPVQVSISYDTFSYNQDADFKVLVLLEPTDILANYRNQIYELNICNQDLINYVNNNFDLVLCWNEKLLNFLTKSKKLPYGECFLDLNKINYEKKNKISYLTSSKTMTVGHNFRHEIYNALSGINNINEFEYVQHMSPPRLETKNEILNDSKFSIILENSRHNNYFTEKIIDCFISKTIPIYWGCSNIDEYFNMDGIILFNDTNNLFEILAGITPELYDEKIQAIEDNFNRAQQFFPVFKKIEEKINECLGAK